MSQENNNIPDGSLLSDIINASNQGAVSETKEVTTTQTTGDAGIIQNGGDASPPPGDPKKNPRAPLPPGMILKVISALFFTGVIFLAIGLAYIIFNPEEAQIFVNMFNIDIPRLKSWLSALVNGSFGILTLSLSIVLFISIFRAIWTPREQKRKKTLSIMISVLFGILMLSTFTFWMYLVQKIGNNVWDGGKIGIYDNILYSNESSRSMSEIRSTENLIGPITLRFDIKGNAKATESNGTIRIERYEINFDGANCTNGSSIISGTSPKTEENIICTFDAIKNYNIRGMYFGKDVTGKDIEVNMELSPVDIGGILSITEQKNIAGKDIVTVDAKSLKLLGDPIWKYENGNDVKADSVTHEPNEIPLFIQLQVGTMSERILLIQKLQTKIGNAKIETTPSSSDPLEYMLSIEDLNIDEATILKVDWIMNNGNIICQNGKKVCNFRFGQYGEIKLKAIVYLTDKTTHEIQKEFIINSPARIAKHAKVFNEAGETLVRETDYDSALRKYIIEKVVPPDILTFDANDVILENPGFTLKEVRWTLSDGKTKIEKIGERVSFDITNSYRYEITGQYTFEKTLPGITTETRIATDSFIVDVEYKNLVPSLRIINQSSDYIPSTVTVDGSESWSEKNEIIKFIYNFGEGKVDTVGDAVQMYEYTTAGEKEITLTIVDSKGERSQIKKTIVLKEAPRTISYMPSISPGIAGIPIDFTVTNAIGQIESYSWSFGDNTPIQRGETVTHVFAKPGEYTIILTAKYSDGIQKQTIGKFEVIAEEGLE